MAHTACECIYRSVKRGGENVDPYVAFSSVHDSGPLKLSCQWWDWPEPLQSINRGHSTGVFKCMVSHDV